MKITQISIANHSRVPQLDLEVRGDMVIVGANDVGKSSILRLLNLALGATTSQLYQSLSAADIAEADEPLVVAVTLDSFSVLEKRLFHREIDVAGTPEHEQLRIRLEVTIDPDDPESVVVNRKLPDRGDDSARLSRDQLDAIGWRYLPATRGSGPAQLLGPNSALRLLLSNLDLGDEKTGLTDLLAQFNIKLDQSESVGSLRESVAGHLSKSMPRIVSSGDISFRSVADPEQSVLEGVSLFVNKDGHQTQITEQSDGVRQLMSMTLFDLSQSTANIVAIDEPELHLHPASQRTLSELFSKSANQKILVTHSPYIVQPHEPWQVVAIGRDGNATQIPRSKISVVDKVRSHWWSHRVLEALTSKYVIVVEGIADRVIVEGVAAALDISLDRCGAMVFELDGADKFANVYKLLGKDGFGTHILGLVDVKESGPWVGAFGGRPKNILGTHVWESKEDLENEYAVAFGGPALARLLIAGGFSEKAIKMSAQATELDDLNDIDMAKFCRKDKVGAATIAAAGMTADVAGRVTSVAALLGKLKQLESN